MTSRSRVIPAPEVQHLTTVFRRIQSGELRVPAFQRGFVWEDTQVVELVESIYKGYPIGSILLWRVEANSNIHLNIVDRQAEFEGRNLITFPALDVKYPVYYVLDGMQRLSTLYGVFYAPDVSDRFDVSFDLTDKEFRLGELNGNLFSSTIRMSDLFVPRKLLDAQKGLAAQSESEVLIESSIELLSAFQDYMIPIVTIASDSIEEVVEIFERVNSTGVRLSRVDFMRALTWSGQFDLNEELGKLQGHFKRQEFYFENETLIKAIAISFGKDPTADSVNELRSYQADELHAGVKRTIHGLQLTIDFLRNHCHIKSSEFVPYEGQILILFHLFNRSTTPDADIIEVIQRWFWRVSFSEALRGKADHYVVRAIRSVDRLLMGNLNALTQRLLLTPGLLLERRFIKEKALSSAIAVLFAINHARYIDSGDEIPSKIFTTKFDPEDFEPILPPETMNAISPRKLPSAKVLSNIVLYPKNDNHSTSKGTALREILAISKTHSPTTANDILRSQFIQPDSLSLLSKGKYSEFLRVRAEVMFEAVKGCAGIIVDDESDYLFQNIDE